jgi:hypothetical protein
MKDTPRQIDDECKLVDRVHANPNTIESKTGPVKLKSVSPLSKKKVNYDSMEIEGNMEIQIPKQ